MVAGNHSNTETLVTSSTKTTMVKLLTKELIKIHMSSGTVLLFLYALTKLEFSQQISAKPCQIISLAGTESFRADGRTDTTNLIVDFENLQTCLKNSTYKGQ
jgi:hypothetical protein